MMADRIFRNAPGGHLEPYVIRRGDYLLSVAHKFGFDADTVWSDPANAKLRQLRPNQNLLYAGDILYIPNPKAPVMKTLEVGATNTFTSDPPTVTLTHQFVGVDETTYASKAYAVGELDFLTGLQTDGNGVATFPVPVTLDQATVTFTETGESYVL